MISLFADLSSAPLFANAPSSFTLALIGGVCLLGYEFFRRKPTPTAPELLSLNQPAAAGTDEAAEIEHRLAA